MKTQYIVAKIHNQSLVSVEAFATLEEAENAIRIKFENQFDRVLDDEEDDDLENLLEVFNEEDDDNHFTFSIGILGE